jgi:hypothetical protein
MRSADWTQPKRRLLLFALALSAITSSSAQSASGQAVVLSPAPGSTFGGSTVTFQWTAGSASAYGLTVGSSPGAVDIYASSVLHTLSQTITNIPTDGRTVYVRLYSRVNDSWTFNSYTYAAWNGSSTPTPTSTPAPIAKPTPTPSPTPDLVSVGPNFKIAWDAVPGNVVGYAVYVSAAAAAPAAKFRSSIQFETTVPSTPSPSYAFNGQLKPGRTYYVAVTAQYPNIESDYSNVISVAVQTPPSTSTPAPELTVMASPLPGSTFGGPTVTFQWTASSASAYGLTVGSSPAAPDIYVSSVLHSLSQAVTNIPTDGRTIYVRLYSRVNSSWTFNSYTYKAFQ